MLPIFQVVNLMNKKTIDHLNLTNGLNLTMKQSILKEVFTSNLYSSNTKIIYLCKLPFCFYASIFQLKAGDGEGDGNGEGEGEVTVIFIPFLFLSFLFSPNIIHESMNITGDTNAY